MKNKGFTLIELMVVIAIIGILMSIAVPAYQDHIVRARVMEGLNLATSAKMAVTEAALTAHKLPSQNTDIGYTKPAPTANVQSVTIGNLGIITVQYTPMAGDGTILLTPHLDTNGELTWTCNTGTLPSKYRPQTCRKT